MDDQTSAGRAYGCEHSLTIPWRDRPEVEQLDPIGEPIRRLGTPMDHRAPRHYGKVAAVADAMRAPERKDVLVAWIPGAAVAGHQQRAVLEKDCRIAAAHRRAQKPDAVGGVRGHHHLPADGVRESHLVAHTVPRISDVLPKAAGHADDDRCREPIGRSPPQRSTVVELLGRRIRVFPELNLRHGHQTRDRHPHGATHDTFLGQARVENATIAELALKAFRDEMDAALASDVFAEHQQLGVHLQLPAKGAPDRLGEANHLAVVGQLLAATESFPVSPGETSIRVRSIRLLEHETTDGAGIGEPARAGLPQPFVDIVLHPRLELAPRFLRHQLRNEILPELRQGVASEVGGNLLLAAVSALIVGTGMAAQPRHRQVHEGGT